jgi:uncharacterized membrane protein YdbT with pleckstrin-like domain
VAERQAGQVSEEQVWEGSPSQAVNLGLFVVCILTCWLVVPVLYAVWRWLQTRCTRFSLTSERLRITTGVLTRRTEEVELYRVKDTALTEPLFLRLFGLGTVEIATTDTSAPQVTLLAIAGAKEVREKIRMHVELSRRRRGVRDVEVGYFPESLWHN